MSSGLRVYIDTDVFAFMLIPDPGYPGDFLKKSTEFFKDIANGVYEGIISTYTETEYKGVIKRVISKVNNSKITLQQERDALRDFHRLIDTVGIGISDSDLLASNKRNGVDLFLTTDPIMNSAYPIYHSKASEGHKWKSIGGSDALIVNMAIRSGANRLATFDRGFKGLNSSVLKSIIIQESY